MILDEWRSSPRDSREAIILPDGCRDVICRYSKGHAPEWFVSPLYDQATKIRIEPGTTMVGYRLQPGAIINEWELMQLLGTDHPDEVEVVDLVREFVTVDYIVEHALEGLSQTNSLVNEVAKQLGLSTRSLQRRMLSATGRSPVYWAQLARIRRAARMLCQNPGFSTAANESGFADQAHFNREFRRWLGVTPGMFLANNDMTGVIQHSGYDGVSTGEHISTKKPLGSVT